MSEYPGVNAKRFYFLLFSIALERFLLSLLDMVKGLM